MKKLFLLLTLIVFNFFSHICYAYLDVKTSLPSKKEFVNSYVKKSTPVLFKGVAKSWKSYDWNLDFFSNKYPEIPVEVQKKETFSNEKFSAIQSIYEKKTLKEYISEIHQIGIKAGYLSQFNILNLQSELNDYINFPKFYSSEMLKVVNIWIGPKGTKSKLHYDSDHNLFVQIHGTKKITLISPKYSENCCPTNVTWFDGYSKIDVENPNLENCPGFKDVEMVQFIIEPGDMLYIPKLWWHDIRSLENSISVNLWWIGWFDFFKEIINQVKYQYIDKKEFDPKNSYWTTFKKNLMRKL